MIIKTLETDGFKNLSNVKLDFHRNLNVFFGENAQGKTNLIEVIWLCTGLKSFRGTKDRDFIGLEKEAFHTELCFEDKDRTQTISYNMSRNNLKEKAVFLNGVRLNSPSRLFSALNCVIFTPEDLELSKGSPENRRRFLDLSVSQIKRSYVGVVNKYDSIINQRNKLLKDISLGVSKKEDLEVWDEQLAKLGAYISVLRYAYTVKLNKVSSVLYSDITSGKEKLSLKLSSTVFENLEGRNDYGGEMYLEYLKKLRDKLDEDIRLGFTQIGVHRDDLVTYINGLPSREYGSQGQNRSVALVLKLSQAYILSEETKDSPVILLDDVLSELDTNRQEFVMSKIKNMQVFITCCEKNKINVLKDGSIFLVDGGVVKKIKRG